MTFLQNHNKILLSIFIAFRNNLKFQYGKQLLNNKIFIKKISPDNVRLTCRIVQLGIYEIIDRI